MQKKFPVSVDCRLRCIPVDYEKRKKIQKKKGRQIGDAKEKDIGNAEGRICKLNNLPNDEIQPFIDDIKIFIKRHSVLYAYKTDICYENQ